MKTIAQKAATIRPRRNFRGRFKREDRRRVNERVRAPEVRLIDEEGKLIGLMPSFEALRQARERGLDLVEIHDKTIPPVCKIMDYGKWKFETKKKEKKNKKNQTKILVKEIQVRLRTDEGDIKIKMDKAREFLKEGHKVKVNLRFFGREMAHKELGFKLLQGLEARLSDLSSPEMPAKMERRSLFTILAPQTGPGGKKPSPAKASPPAEGPVVQKTALKEIKAPAPQTPSREKPAGFKEERLDQKTGESLSISGRD